LESAQVKAACKMLINWTGLSVYLGYSSKLLKYRQKVNGKERENEMVFFQSFSSADQHRAI